MIKIILTPENQILYRKNQLALKPIWPRINETTKKYIHILKRVYYKTQRRFILKLPQYYMRTTSILQSALTFSIRQLSIFGLRSPCHVTLRA